MPRIRRFLRESGGIRPVPRTRRIGHITAGEREEISRGVAADDSARTIAEKLGRSPSTISRERSGRHRVRSHRAARQSTRRDPCVHGFPDQPCRTRIRTACHGVGIA
ncbi:helix-turn-helix domain-containing protein [Nocardia sp. NPDC049190]|uniref:helix-turn-helix domain-containing protein n=1 Tax=Nocardia sp. NPDC049190 TaxID=3155650 RepID=UPI0033C8998C